MSNPGDSELSGQSFNTKFDRTDPQVVLQSEQIKVQSQTRDAVISGNAAAEKFRANVNINAAGNALITIGLQALGGAKDIYDGFVEGLEKSRETIENIDRIRVAYGGAAVGTEDVYVSESAVSNAIRRFSVITQAASNSKDKIMGMTSSGEELLKKLTKSGENIFDKYFDNAEDAAQNVADILTRVSTTYGDHVAKLSDEQIAKLAFYEDSLGVTNDDIQRLFQKQIGFTEEITLDSMDKIGYYANNLSRKLNIPAKTLTQMSMKMINNTEMFGDITDIEATRMAAKLTQLGYTYEELNAVQSKFATFSGAAQSAGTIAQLTGAQVDALKMSYLASEGKFDELIEYQRDSLLKAGMTKERFLSMSNSMKNAIAKEYGRSQEELAFMLSNQRKISSQAELDAMMGKEEDAAEKGFEELLNNLTSTKKAFETIDDIKDNQIKKMYHQTGMAAFKSAQKMSKFNTQLTQNTDLLGGNVEKFKELSTGYNNAINTLTKTDGSKVKMTDLGNILKTQSDILTNQVSDILGQAESIKSQYKDVIKENNDALPQLEQQTLKLNEIQELNNSSPANSPESNTTDLSPLAGHFNTLNTAIDNLSKSNKSLDLSTMPQGAIQVLIDGKQIPGVLKVTSNQ